MSNGHRPTVHRSVCHVFATRSDYGRTYRLVSTANNNNNNWCGLARATNLVGKMNLVDNVILGAGGDELDDIIAGEEVRLNGQNLDRFVRLQRFTEFLSRESPNLHSPLPVTFTFTA